MSQGSDDSFLSRWSRRKAQVRQGVTPEPPQPAPPGAPAAVPRELVAPAAIQAPARETPPPLPTLADVEALTPASDFARFVAPGVDAEVKNSALKKLFADPHYNVMDGLDTYIEDYGRADPIPRSMLRQMVQARLMGLLDDELEEQRPPDGGVPAMPVALPAAETVERAALLAAAPADTCTGAEGGLAAPPAEVGVPLAPQPAADGADPGPNRSA